MRTLLITLAALLTLAALPLFVSAQPAQDKKAKSAQTFTIDGVHSAVVFKIKHLGVGDFYGRFNDISGEFTWREGHADDCSVDVAIAAESVDTGNQQRDNHLRSPDFFNAAEHEQITFVSDDIKRVGENYEAHGELTLHGVTRPVVVTLVWNGAGDKGQRFGYRGGLSAEFTIKRTDFGMDTYVENGLLGDEVTLMVGLEGVRK
jgi:polyisoprenoid-binding protein YceI